MAGWVNRIVLWLPVLLDAAVVLVGGIAILWPR
jgi:hypothetical protein